MCQKQRNTERIIYDFSTVQPADQVTSSPTLGKWRLMDWDSPIASGKLLWAYREGGANLTLPLNAQGWYAVSLGLWSLPQGQSRIRVRLNGEPNWEELWVRTPCRWLPEGGCRFEEHFWRLANLTERSLEIAAAPACSGLGFVRLIPLDEDQVDMIKNSTQVNWLWTNDGRGTFIEDKEPPSRAVTDNIDAFAGTEFTDFSWSVFAADVVNYDSVKVKRFDCTGKPSWRDLDESMSRNMARLADAGDDANELAITYGAGKNMRVWLAQRLQLFSLEPPKDIVVSDFFKSRRDLACMTRDGRPMAQMSFAQPEVRNYLIDILCEMAKYRPFGLNLQFNRGVPCTNFEKPVLDDFTQTYGVDIRKCDVLDERVVALRSSYVTAFMRELRQRLDTLGCRDVQISVNCLQNKALNDEFGLDIAAWIQEGLITYLLPYRWEWRGEDKDNVWKWHDPYDMTYFQKLVKGTPCKVYPYAYNNNNHRYELPHQHRARALNLIRQGAEGLCAWDAPPQISQQSMGRPGELEVWEQVSQPLPQQDIRTLGGFAIDEYSPHYGC